MTLSAVLVCVNKHKVVWRKGFYLSWPVPKAAAQKLTLSLEASIIIQSGHETLFTVGLVRSAPQDLDTTVNPRRCKAQ